MTTDSSLRAAILLHRAAIRAHRDARGDDRCWVDDHNVWASVDPKAELTVKPTFNEGMRLCRAFYEKRNATTTDQVPADAVTDPAQWDADLQTMTTTQLQAECDRLVAAIQTHHAIPQGRHTTDDDRALYIVLPEKMPADFRLPPEPDFLGEAKAPRAGCPSYWRSHENCPAAQHNLHRWGPCDSNEKFKH